MSAHANHAPTDMLDTEKKHHLEHVEDVDALESDAPSPDAALNGTVGLTTLGGETILVPTPSADPSGEFRPSNRNLNSS